MTVTPAPGSNPKSKMVLSSVPHFFQYKGNGRFACDSSCLHWKSSGICSHSIAAAETVGDLSEFLKWFVSSTQAAISMDGLSSGRGRKGRRPKRQKGKKTPVETSFTCNYTVHTASTPTQGSTAHTQSNEQGVCNSVYNWHPTFWGNATFNPSRKKII